MTSKPSSPIPSSTCRNTSRGARSQGVPSGQLGVARQTRQPGRQLRSWIVSGSGCTSRSAAPVRMPNRAKSVIGVSTGSRPRIRSVITVPWRSADSKAAGRSAFPRIDPLTSGIPRSTNSVGGAASGAHEPAAAFFSELLDRALHVPDRGREPLDHLGELRVGARVRRGEQHLVPRVAVRLRVRRRDEQAVLERRVVDERRGVQLVGQERRPVARVDELDAQQEAATADLADDVGSGQGGLEILEEARPTLADALHEASLDDQVEDGETDGRGQGCTVPGVPQVELPRPLVDGVVDVLPAEDARRAGRGRRRAPCPR